MQASFRQRWEATGTPVDTRDGLVPAMLEVAHNSVWQLLGGRLIHNGSLHLNSPQAAPLSDVHVIQNVTTDSLKHRIRPHKASEKHQDLMAIS